MHPMHLDSSQLSIRILQIKHIPLCRFHGLQVFLFNLRKYLHKPKTNVQYIICASVQNFLKVA